MHEFGESRAAEKEHKSGRPAAGGEPKHAKPQAGWIAAIRAGAVRVQADGRARLSRSAGVGHRAFRLLGGDDRHRQPELLHAARQVPAQPV